MFNIKCNTCNNLLEYKSKKAANAAVRANRRCRLCKKKERSLQSWLRSCPSCKTEITYARKGDFKKAQKTEQICRKCADKSRRTINFSGLKRNCPRCNKEITYNISNSCTRANRAGSLCKSCIAKSYYEKPGMLGSSQYRNNMIDIGLYHSLYGKSHLEWSKEYNMPPTTFNLFAKNNKNISESKLITFCKNYKANKTILENIIEKSLSLPFFNKKCHKNLRYRPDFKICDDKYLNTDGLFWHSERVNKDKYYHFNMRKEYETLGLRILQFRANEVTNKLNIISSMVDNLSGNTKNKTGARKCRILKVKTLDAVEFLNQNHMKGFMNSNHKGLYYNGMLIAIMSYKLNKNKNGRFIKIDRFCSKVEWNVIGGFSKLLKNIQSDYPNFPVHYWVDLRYGTGTFLLNHKFKLKKETLGWEWTDFNATYNRLKCRANMDKRGLSESQHAEELGWCKIYDAGQRLYIKQS